MIDLSENHRRSVSIILQLVDKALCEWSDWNEGKVRSGVMYRELDTLSPRQKNELQTKIAAIRQLITNLRDDLDLQRTSVLTSRSVAGHASLLWEMLSEMNSRSLQAYGAVPEALGTYLDPIGANLAEQMNSISALFSKPNEPAN